MRTIYSYSGGQKLKLILKMISAKKTVGRNTDGTGDFLNHSIIETKLGLKHETEYDSETISLLGANVEKKWWLHIDKKSENTIKSLIKQNNKKKIIVWHVGGMPSRRLPENLLNNIINLINENDLGRIVFCGSDEELKIIDQNKFFCALRNLSFDELCALISAGDIFMSNDTGPMHIGAVLKKKMISFFGPGDFIRFDPRYINENARIFYKKAECAPCENYSCNEKICFNHINELDVIDTIRGLLKIKE